VSPADKSLKRPARRPGAGEKFFCPGTRFAVIPLIIEVIRYNIQDNPLMHKSQYSGR